MSSIVRTIHTTHPLLKISKMVAVLLLIFLPAIAFANPIFQSSSSSIGNQQASSIRNEQSYRATPISYEMTHTATYQIGTTYNPAQTLYEPFSNENPNNSNNGPSRINGRKNEGEYDDEFPNSGEYDRSDEFPIGDVWSLLFFALVAAGLIFIKQRKGREVRGERLKVKGERSQHMLGIY